MLAPAPRVRLTQLSVEKTQKSVAHPTPTAGFRMMATSPDRLPARFCVIQGVAGFGRLKSSAQLDLNCG